MAIGVLNMATERKPKNKGGRPPALQPDARTLKALRGLGKINATHVEAAAGNA